MLQNFKLQIQPQEMSVSNFYNFTKPKYKKTVASSDLGPDPSAGLDSVGVIDQGFLGPSNHQQDQTMLRNFKL